MQVGHFFDAACIWLFALVNKYGVYSLLFFSVPHIVIIFLVLIRSKILLPYGCRLQVTCYKNANANFKEKTWIKVFGMAILKKWRQRKRESFRRIGLRPSWSVSPLLVFNVNAYKNFDLVRNSMIDFSPLLLNNLSNISCWMNLFSAKRIVDFDFNKIRDSNVCCFTQILYCLG